MKTTLQQITDLLEAGGIHVSAVETYPMEDGVVPVSLRVRTRPIDPDEAGIIDFIEGFTTFDKSFCEDASALYRAYVKFIGEDQPCVSRNKFSRFVKRIFPECKYMQAQKPDGEPVLIFSGLRLISPAASPAPEGEDRDEPGNSGCHVCPNAGIDCDTCPNGPENGTPVKLYTPEEAAAAMLAGKVLKNHAGTKFFFANIKGRGIGFFYQGDNGLPPTFVHDLGGLYSEGGGNA